MRWAKVFGQLGTNWSRGTSQIMMLIIMTPHSALCQRKTSALAIQECGVTQVEAIYEHHFDPAYVRFGSFASGGYDARFAEGSAARTPTAPRVVHTPPRSVMTRPFQRLVLLR